MGVNYTRSPYIVHGEKETKSTEDMLASLAKEVAQLKRQITALESQVSSNTSDIQTFAETAESADYKATSADYKAGQALTSTKLQTEVFEEMDAKVEMLIDDMVTIDERTQPLVAEGVSEFASELAEMIERKINESYRKGRI